MRNRLFPILFCSAILTAALAATVTARQIFSGDVVTLACVYFEDLPADNNVIRADTLFAKMRAGEEMFILDVRRPDDYEKGHLKGAMNLSFFGADIPAALEQIPNDRPVFVYCYTGQTGAQVTVLLNIAGKKAKNIQSGFTNGIAVTEGYAALLEEAKNSLPATEYPVDAAVKEALRAYFTDKMTQNGTPFANFNVTAATVNTILNENDGGYLILSVRQAADYAKSHIPTARNIPFGKGMEKELALLPKDKKIVVNCYTGQTASQTVVALRLMGYEAYSMSGGMNAWVHAGFATTI